MHLSPSEFFILGRIVAAWRVAFAMEFRPYWGSSLMETVNHVFAGFGLEYVGPPGTWGEVERRPAPTDTVWKTVEGWSSRWRNHDRFGCVIPGIPCLAMGVSPSVPDRLFVKRVDGDVCAWVITLPVSGLYIVMMRWLSRWAALSPHLWLAMHASPWAAVGKQWSSLPIFHRIHPHMPYGEDSTDGLEEAALTEARAAGCEQAFTLGSLAAEVEARLLAVAERAQQADAFHRHENEYLGDPEENLRDALGEAVDAVGSVTVQEICRSDDGAIGFYDSARRAVGTCDGPLGGVETICRAIEKAHGRAMQASAYLYGTFRAAGPA